MDSEARAQILKDSQEVKYIQYVPKKMGNTVENAIKSIYKTTYTNVKQDPELRHNHFSQSYIYGQQGHQCKGNHHHSKQCSKVKDFDLAVV